MFPKNLLYRLSLIILLCGTNTQLHPDLVDAYSLNANRILTWQDLAAATLDVLKTTDMNNFFDSNSTNNNGTILNQFSNLAQNLPSNYSSNQILIFDTKFRSFLSITSAYPFSGDGSTADIVKVITYPFTNMPKCQIPWMSTYLDPFIELYSATINVLVPEPLDDYLNPFLNTLRNALSGTTIASQSIIDPNTHSINPNPVTLSTAVQNPIPPLDFIPNPSLTGIQTYYLLTQNPQLFSQIFPNKVADYLASSGLDITLQPSPSSWLNGAFQFLISDLSISFGAEIDTFFAKTQGLFVTYQTLSPTVQIVLYPFMKNLIFGLNQFVTDQTLQLFGQIDSLVIMMAFTLNNYSFATSDPNASLFLQKLMTFHNEAHTSVFTAQKIEDDLQRYKWVNSFEEFWQTGGASSPKPLISENLQGFPVPFYSDFESYLEGVQTTLTLLSEASSRKIRRVEGMTFTDDFYKDAPHNVKEMINITRLFCENVLLPNAEMMFTFIQNQWNTTNSFVLPNDMTDDEALSTYQNFITGYFNSFFIDINNKLTVLESRIIALLEGDATTWFYDNPDLPNLISNIFFNITALTGTGNYYFDNEDSPFYNIGLAQQPPQDLAQVLGINELITPLINSNYNIVPHPLDVVKCLRYSRISWYKDLICILDGKTFTLLSNKLNLFGYITPVAECGCNQPI